MIVSVLEIGLLPSSAHHGSGRVPVPWQQDGVAMCEGPQP